MNARGRASTTAPADGAARRSGRARQERGVRTEEAILTATMELLATRGIHGTSLDVLAEKVGVAKSSILWHFGSKEELLLRVAERVFETVAQGPIQDILDMPSFEARAEASWRFFAETMRHHPALRRVTLYLIFESVEGRPELRERLQQLYRNIRDLWAAGLRTEIPDAARRSRLAAISVAALDGIFLQWLLDPDAFDLDALHAELRDLVARARREHRRETRRKGANDDGQ